MLVRHPKKRLRFVLGKNLRRIRNQRGWTQDQLALACRMSQRWITKVESGKSAVSIDSLEKLAKGLKMDPRDLLA
jgi:transcriptional regulator with XRE-family HTH domain